MMAKDAKYGFGQLVDVTHADPVAVPKHARPVIVVAREEFEQLNWLDLPTTVAAEKRKAST